MLQKQLTRTMHHACSIVRNIAWSIGVKLTATKKFVLVTVIARPKGVALNAFYDQN